MRPRAVVSDASRRRSRRARGGDPIIPKFRPSSMIVSNRPSESGTYSSAIRRTSRTPRCAQHATAPADVSMPTTASPRPCRCRQARPPPQPTSSTRPRTNHRPPLGGIVPPREGCHEVARVVGAEEAVVALGDLHRAPPGEHVREQRAIHVRGGDHRSIVPSRAERARAT
jgi:hypothetical protein